MADNVGRRDGWPQDLWSFVSAERGESEPGRHVNRMTVQPEHIAPNGYMQATVLIGLADMTCAGGTLDNLPDGATSFTTVEIKSNLLRTARAGDGVCCEAIMQHGGRRTQVWDATLTHEATGKPLMLFRCTQMLLYP